MSNQVSASDRSRFEALVNDLWQAINQDNSDRIKFLSSELQQALMQVGGAILCPTSEQHEWRTTRPGH
ncbi:MAG: hypothetical protein V7K47_17800 [Nostoc sp.]